MKPKYSLAPLVSRSEVDPGDVAIIDLFISGHGAVEENKIVLINSNVHLLADNPGDGGQVHVSSGVTSLYRARLPSRVRSMYPSRSARVPR